MRRFARRGGSGPPGQRWQFRRHGPRLTGTGGEAEDGPADLGEPAAIPAYLTAHRARDVETAVEAYAVDAVVIDEARTYRGREEIRTWLGRAAGEYTFTTEFVSATRVGVTRYDVVRHLEGDFPGGVVDLHFRFTLDGAAISRLVIEP